MAMKKLSEKQKEVIRFMQEGHKMYKNVTYVTLVRGNGCSVSTFFALVNNGIIRPHRRFFRGIGTQYVLTNHALTTKF